ncbi:uncharacterized protein MONBRDRAFT_32459 [Monosiga brevicollis MX1]|uniref:Uncharacterized protein n=1 Tax=Monosiga brevicollis TaxID=81824 RepID=A9UZM2_MONBE|nr:uncharacterized protein MONBRDRAFT_32459 [Monosiga brevicollis MX1]EDQ89256.1 predicted protein [Monosiga brevicollis MX1]|eukprot:XP_001745832.1 hypothetical protein [Monosiga brevicollis MX1]
MQEIEEALQLLTSWDPQRIRAAAKYEDWWLNTPLHFACQFGHDEEVEMLLGHGADVKAKAIDGETPLHKACGCENGAAEVVEKMLEHGVDANAKKQDGQTPLHAACAAYTASRKSIHQLLRHGADPDTSDLTGTRPVDLLLHRDSIELELIEELLGAIRTPCSYHTSNSHVQCLINAEQVRRWRVGWRVDPRLFNIQDLQTLCDCLAARTFAAQTAPTN